MMRTMILTMKHLKATRVKNEYLRKTNFQNRIKYIFIWLTHTIIFPI